MTSQLADLDQQFRAVSERARAVVAQVGESCIALRPAPDQWSIAECLVHLRLSSEAYFPIWRDVFARARSQGRLSNGPFRMDLRGKALAWFLEPPPKVRFKAPPSFVPLPESGPPGDILPAFLRSQDQLLEIVAGAGGLALDQFKIVSPFDSRMRYRVWSSLCVTAAHERRHLWQAGRVAAFVT